MTSLRQSLDGPFKIALIGSHGVGKTTLCYDLAARLKRRDLEVHLVAEIARSCPLPINTETTLDAHNQIVHNTTGDLITPFKAFSKGIDSIESRVEDIRALAAELDCSTEINPNGQWEAFQAAI